MKFDFSPTEDPDVFRVVCTLNSGKRGSGNISRLCLVRTAQKLNKLLFNDQIKQLLPK